MKNIVKSLAVIAGVAAIVVGGTIAYYSDREVSAGNTFTAGELDLKIDSDCHFNGMDCKIAPDGKYRWDGEDNNNRCYCVWNERDLTSEKFFNFTNLKPGDFGEATISMHVIGDDAYARFKVDNIKNYDNGCNVPEGKVDTTCGNPGTTTSGELGENMDFAIWFDMGSQWGYQGKDVDPEEGDNKLNGVEEVLVHDNGNASAGEYVELKYDGTYIPFRDCATYYIGVAWCVGDMPNATSGDLTCDGSTAGNIIQSDSYSSDSIFEVVQATHNNPANPFSGM